MSPDGSVMLENAPEFDHGGGGGGKQPVKWWSA